MTTGERMEQQKTNPLAAKSISSLLVKYALPSVVSMLVMSLYNIVDQLFIGWGVGYLGNSATTVAFPLVTVGLALSLLVGNGAAAFVSLELGKGRPEQARSIVGNAITLLLVFGVLYTSVALLGLPRILAVVGATDAVMPYALDYTSVIVMGMPFAMMGPAVTTLIRADGSPRFSMIANLTGAILNTILDPIFIFVFGMGVRGAAIATVISQIVSAAMVFVYLFRFSKHIRFSPRDMAPKGDITRRMLALGSSSFITQMAITVLNIVLNNAVRHYGGLSVYGSEIPLAAMGIVMKINGILISTILGVAIGAQPILGFNYGAGNYERVRRTYKTEVSITFVLSTVCWILFLTMPDAIIRVFGDKASNFNEFGAMAMRTFLGGVFCAGIQIPSANYFQAVGKPLKAMVLSMSRQILFLIPAILILPLFFGLQGVLYAGPVGDVCALCVTLIFITRELRLLRGKELEETAEALPNPNVPLKP